MTHVLGRGVVAGLAVAVVAGAVIAGFFIVGSPAEARMRRLDGRRVQDLIDITHTTNAYWSKHEQLPTSLEEMLSGPGAYAQSRDPGTGQSYGYRALGGKAYELCADFQRESSEESQFTNRFWSHSAGRRCFQLEADQSPKP
jgi:hypothetical protein